MGADDGAPIVMRRVTRVSSETAGVEINEPRHEDVVIIAQASPSQEHMGGHAISYWFPFLSHLLAPRKVFMNDLLQQEWGHLLEGMDDKRRPGKISGARPGGWDGDTRDAGACGGPHSFGGVFERDTPGGRCANQGRGLQEYLGIGLGSGDILAAQDGREIGAEPEALQDDRGVGTPGTCRQKARDAPIGQSLQQF